MARANQPDRNLRNEVQSQIDDLHDETGLDYDSDILPEAPAQGGMQTGAAQTGTAQTAMRTKATPKTSMQNKKGNQPPSR